MIAKRNPAAAGNRNGAQKSWRMDYLNNKPDARTTSRTADEIYEQAVVEAASELGFTVSLPCRVCGHPLTDPKSVAVQVGPRCRSKAGGRL